MDSMGDSEYNIMKLEYWMAKEIGGKNVLLYKTKSEKDAEFHLKKFMRKGYFIVIVEK